MSEVNLAAVILAAGKGTRMKSDRAKVLHPLDGRPMVCHVLETVRQLNPQRTLLVVGHQAEEVERQLADSGAEFVLQRPQLGTGHAVLQVREALADFSGCLVVLCGDMPLIRIETLKKLILTHRQAGAECTLLSLKTPEPRDFGRVVRDTSGRVVRIVEARDASASEKNIDEYNSGVYCFNKDIIFKALESIGRNNAQGEYYLTDVVQYLAESGRRVECLATRDAAELLGINSMDDLAEAERIHRARREPDP